MKIRNLLLVFALSVFLLGMIGCSKEEEPAQKTEPTTEEATMPAKVEAYTVTAEDIGTEANDPVCGMTVTVAEDTPALMYDGEAFFFCTADDKDKFAANPEMYMGEGGEKMEMMQDSGQ